MAQALELLAMIIMVMVVASSAAPSKMPRINGAGGAIVFRETFYLEEKLRAPGPLTGLTFGVKDSFDVEGHTTGFGNPIWHATHPPAAKHSPAVQALLKAGAACVGKTVMDELAYSLNGQNAHYGTPTNPVCPGAIPGGSSSGSAVAVSGKLVDFALAEDTGGSIRVPASYNGLYAMRPTHGRVSTKGSRPLAPSFDTAGAMARSADLLATAMNVLLSTGDSKLKQPAAIDRFLVVDDAFAIMNEDARTLMMDLIESKMSAIIGVLGQKGNVTVGTKYGNLTAWPGAIFTPIQGYEAWRASGPWITEYKPELGPGIKERFALAANFTRQNYTVAGAKRAEIRADLETLLGRNTVLLLPAAPGPAIPLTATPADANAFRGRALALTAIAGLGGLPQVVMPAVKVGGCPVGIGLVGPPGSDEVLLDLAVKLDKVLNG